MKKFILIITIILFIFSLLFYFYCNLKNIYKKKVLNLSFWRNKYSDHHKEYLEFLTEIIPYLEKWKIKYWAHAGTLLGCVRHNGFIPWDDDIDFGYIDDGNIEDLKNDLINNGYQINLYILGIKVDFNIGFNIISKNNIGILIDMFKFNKKNDMLVQLDKPNKIWPNENYYYNEVFPLKIAKFNNIYLPIPNNSESFCKRAFGNNYMDEFYIKTPHLYTFINNKIDGFGIRSISKEKFYIKDLIDE
jgi:phosphorylcholine metabolism protein LicD